MPKHLYLPTLRSDANIPPASREGFWQSSPRKILRQVSDGISVGNESAGHGVSSVPDVWARPLMFKSILAPPSGAATRTTEELGAGGDTSDGRDHSLWTRMMGEWRGLLSLLALRDIKKYRVEIVRVVLEQTEFESALRGLAPAPVQLERDRAYPWTDVFLIKWDGVPVGALSPSTLVFTGTAYNRKLAGREHTLIDAEGYLRAPTGSEESRQVQAWVAGLHNDLKGNGRDIPGLLLAPQKSGDADTGGIADATAILKLLASWLDQLSHQLASVEVAPLGNVLIAPEPTGIGDDARKALTSYRVYERLLRPLEAEKSATASDMALNPPPKEPARAGQVVVITRHLLEANHRIWGDVRLADFGMDVDRAMRVLFNDRSGSAIGDIDLQSRHAIWIRPERYFLSDVLIQSAGRSRVLNNDVLDANVDGRFVLPFRREILDYFTPAQIVKLLSPSYREAGNGITFSFTLPVGSGMERIERTYRASPTGAEDGTLQTVEVPVIEIFPNYVNDNWRRYYVFQTDADTVAVEPIAIGGNVVATQRTRKISRKATADSVRIWSLSGDGAFPQAVQLASADGKPRGLILLDHDDGTPLSGSRKWQVGVDFGTSNTQVFYSESDEDRPKPMSFDFSRKRSLTESDERRESIAREHFVPAGVKTLPIPTTLRLFNRVGTPELLLDRLIYFSRAYDLPDDVLSDMKWDDTASGPAKLFLEDLVFLILLKAAHEGVGEIRMRWSYPKAFSALRQGQMKGVWNKIMVDLLDGDARVELRSKLPGTTLARTAPFIPDPTAAAEGIAAGYYFASDRTIQSASDRADIGDAAVTLDVGGATTDISIWDHENIVLDASVLLAGREIVDFIRGSLTSGSDFLSNILSGEALTALEAVVDNPATFAARLNLVLTEEGDALRAGLGRNIGPEARRLRQLVALEFAAITFYASMLLGSAARRPGSDLREKVGDHGTRFHWGGNAAKFLHWVDLGGYVPGGQPPEARAEPLLRAIGFYGLKDAMPQDEAGDAETPSGYKGLRHSLSPGHKSEAAGGLVVMPRPAQPRIAQVSDWTTALDSDDRGEDSTGATDVAGMIGIVCGEDVELQDGRQLKATDSVSESLLFAGDRSTIKRVTLNRLTRFIEIFNRFGVKFGLLDAGEAIDIARMAPDIEKRVRAHYVSLENSATGKRTIEPVFIVEVRTLLSFLHG